ncbi:Putative flippase GtrA (transmembrane translocase of bactoprenol-linked glucose) [Andreprevotia lacus DSM 23236]|uniref:Putative flippase GtrA (Transmembrane translocase of bactoprenol-linked glucose) n=1 Tax=Andreprevotia lacus DSM 23236 TaxID=1121001 RepID=A0A1W1XRJ6_9NEIS|nr:GtrA family protein [Andreprevotia lacus]SMC26526.1 Putative flippase GtrA (transmembrane translocase of bactoprenol-linked glucose) [Andreprevotia lacus DSM 23236]
MSWRRQIIKAASVGLVGTGIQYLTLFIGVRYLGASEPGSSAVGFLLGSIANYVLNYIFTFESSKSHLHAATRYYAVLAVGWVLNYLLMSLLTGYPFMKRNYFVAQFITTGICFVWHFAGSRLWAFKEHPTQGEAAAER